MECYYNAFSVAYKHVLLKKRGSHCVYGRADEEEDKRRATAPVGRMLKIVNLSGIVGMAWGYGLGLF